MTGTKTIAIVGATGNMGSVIARSLAGTKNRIVLVARNEVKLNVLKQELRQVNGADVHASLDAKEAAREADIVVLAVPAAVEMQVARAVQEVVLGKIVISVSARNNQLDDISAAEELQRKLPHSRVVKTFNTSFISTFVSPAVSCRSAEIFIAGNNGKAVASVANLAEQAGFNAVVVGDLSTSRALERMGIAQCQPLKPANLSSRKGTPGGKNSGPTIL